MPISPVNNLSQSRVTSFGNNKAKPNSPYVIPQIGAPNEASKKAPIAFKQVRKAMAGMLLGAATVFGAAGCTSPIFYMIENEGKTSPVQTPPTKPTLTSLDKKMIEFVKALNPEETINSSSPTAKFQKFSFQDEVGNEETISLTSESVDKIDALYESRPVGYPEYLCESSTLHITELDKGVRFTYPDSTTQDFVIVGDGTIKETSTYTNFPTEVRTLKPGNEPGTMISYTKDGDIFSTWTHLKVTLSEVVAKLLKGAKKNIRIG